MKHNKEFYINYFKNMEEKFIEKQLTDKQWIGIVMSMHNAIFEEKLFTREELAELFPQLLAIKEG